jgi:hypothetical protein
MVRATAWCIPAQRNSENDQHDDAGHYSYVERIRENISHIKRSLSLVCATFLRRCVSYFTFSVIIIVMAAIKDLYRTPMLPLPIQLTAATIASRNAA